ncbi:hypothetical protein H2200_003903 [Cladophialophora chaetospira]|uniref:DUF7918 domain-containing protein n=1 Tax=Cladophialophora chaetospira TaxID=386627 RepID=A0AA39CLH2_9EURO|nr:hypothetical protein H2200_003903 [Cladophialophora chaetospira]
MPSQGHIEVQVLVDDQPLLEHPDPDHEAGDDHQMTRYVEVKAGQKFKVNVTLLPGFHFQRANHVYITLHIDHQSATHWGAVSYQDVTARRGEVQKSWRKVFHGCALKDATTSRWFMTAYEFGVLGIGNYVETGEAKAPNPVVFEYHPVEGEKGKAYEFKFLYRNKKILQSLGCIPRSPSPPPDRELMLQRSEDTVRLLKQRERNHNLEVMSLRERLARAESGSRAGSVIDLESDASTLVGSREASVKVELDIKPNASRERSTTLKIEPRSSVPPPPSFTDTKQDHDHSVDGSTLGSRAKRTREEAMLDDDDELLEMAPPPRKPRIVVDLTDDCAVSGQPRAAMD